MTNVESESLTDPVSAPAGPAMVAGVVLLGVLDAHRLLESVKVTPDAANKTPLRIGCALELPSVCRPASEK